MQRIHDPYAERALDQDGYVNYVQGAKLAGFKKVADAMLAYGVV